jgi:hypothetical protein
VNKPILEACAVIGVIAEVGVPVVVITREIPVRAAAEAVMSVVEAAARAGAVKLGTTKAAHACASGSTQVIAAYAATTKSATNMSTAESTARVAATNMSTAGSAGASECVAHVCASEASSISESGRRENEDKRGDSRHCDLGHHCSFSCSEVE